MNNPVVAVNVYSVPKGKEEEFLTWWYEMKKTLIGAPGFIAVGSTGVSTPTLGSILLMLWNGKTRITRRRTKIACP
jgi:heme-degrading monooxygenase HmoA